MTTVVRMTLANESITFTPEGVFIQPVLSNRFRFTGTVDDLISIMIVHKELEIDNAHFFVRVPMDSPHFCGFCRGLCDGEHYISPSTEDY